MKRRHLAAVRKTASWYASDCRQLAPRETVQLEHKHLIRLARGVPPEQIERRTDHCKSKGTLPFVLLTAPAQTQSTKQEPTLHSQHTHTSRKVTRHTSKFVNDLARSQEKAQ